MGCIIICHNCKNKDSKVLEYLSNCKNGKDMYICTKCGKSMKFDELFIADFEEGEIADIDK